MGRGRPLKVSWVKLAESCAGLIVDKFRLYLLFQVFMKLGVLRVYTPFAAIRMGCTFQ